MVNAQGAEGVTAVKALSLAKGLKQLRLLGTEIGDEGAAALAEVIQLIQI